MTELATPDDYRDLIAEARALVIAWRDASPRASTANEEPAIEWFDRWRDDAIVKYNSLPQYLVDPNPDMLATRLDEIKGESRAMAQNCSWTELAPGAVKPFTRFADKLEALWSKIPQNGTPEAVEAAPLYRELAGEFEPAEPRQG